MANRPGPTVVVLGSVHMDLIARADRLPGPGESVVGNNFTMGPGGKGGNQACQLALAGANAYIAARLGDDDFGRQLLAELKVRGVDTSCVAIDAEFPTGASTIFSGEGDYSSIIVPGAASRLSVEDIERARPAIADADALVVQMELPVGLSGHAAAMAAAMGKAVIVNASPAPDSWSDIPQSLWRATSLLIVNAVEAGRLLGRTLQDNQLNAGLAELAARSGIETIVVTLGSKGAAAFTGGELVCQAALPVEPVDAVGAGDAFLGAFIAGRLEGLPISDALRRGVAAGALAVSRPGVHDALPSRHEIDAFLSRTIES